MYVRFQPGGGDQTISMGGSGNLPQKVFSNYIKPPLGTRPAYPAKRPPYKSDVPCYKNPLPDVNGAAIGPPDGGAGAAVRAAGASASRLSPFGGRPK
jgi:phospholipid/cholesterol/gamma-HCH transport system substrate-binding protein